MLIVAAMGILRREALIFRRRYPSIRATPSFRDSGE